MARFPSDLRDRSEYFREYHARNKERRNARSKAWRDANPERSREQSRRWAETNPEKVQENLRRHHRTEKYRVTRAVRRNRDVPGHASKDQIEARVIYFGSRCWVCRAPYDSIDHVKPLARGGSNWPGNLRPICRPCNTRKKDRWPLSAEARKAG